MNWGIEIATFIVVCMIIGLVIWNLSYYGVFS
jgi:hypothetical protein